MSASPTERFVSGGDIAALVDAEHNRAVLDYLRESSPSCHSDNGEALILAAQEKCGDWLAFSPSFQQCRYVALIANRRIFALGIGQRAVCFRLPQEAVAIALQSGGAGVPQMGPDWVRFELFRPDWPKPDLPFWTLQAYAAARRDHIEGL